MIAWSCQELLSFQQKTVWKIIHNFHEMMAIFYPPPQPLVFRPEENGWSQTRWHRLTFAGSSELSQVETFYPTRNAEDNTSKTIDDEYVGLKILKSNWVATESQAKSNSQATQAKKATHTQTNEWFCSWEAFFLDLKGISNKDQSVRIRSVNVDAIEPRHRWKAYLFLFVLSCPGYNISLRISSCGYFCVKRVDLQWWFSKGSE